MATRTYLRSFAGGEISPEMFGRIDDTKYQAGAALVKNFIVTPQGPLQNRPGLQYVAETKYSPTDIETAPLARLIPFTFSTTQTMVIEVGPGYFRFHTQGATLKDASGKPYEVANSYQTAHLFDLHFVQSADVMTITHPSCPVMELTRLGALDWKFAQASFSPEVSAPTKKSTSTSGFGSINYWYVVTAVASDGVSESSAGEQIYFQNNLFQTGNWNTIEWNPSAGASRYNVYKQQGGIYGYIGSTESTSFMDDNISPDMSKTPPKYDNVFFGNNGYPAAVAYYQQRRCFGGTNAFPQQIWMTKAGTESVMSYSLPTRDDDRISFRAAAREVNTIRHIVPLGQLLLLTSSAEFRVTAGSGGEAITPSNISVAPQSFIGASNVQPVVINNSMLFCAARGGHVREMGYSWQSSGYVTGDLSLRSAHLFDGFNITDMAYSKAPVPIVWFVSSSGKLLGLTYIPEQQVAAWHQHETDGKFESCCVVAEGDEDVLYCVVARKVNGKTRRYVERMHARQFAAREDAFFVDCGLTYTGAPATTISGLSHLEGKTVSILADGAVQPSQEVTNGQITLDVAASKVHVGLPITADLQTLPAVAQVDSGFGQGRMMSVTKAWVRVYRSAGLYVGTSDNNLIEAKWRTTEPMNAAPSLKSEDIPVTMPAGWDRGGQVLVRQSDPLPLTIVALATEVAVGG